jgi:sulfur carrier protein ThiS
MAPAGGVTGDPGRGVRITFKLFATLGQHLPEALDGHLRAGNQIALELPEGTAVQAVIDRFPLPPRLVHLVLVNGTYLAPGARADHRLRDGDVLAIWPPVAGG